MTYAVPPPKLDQSTGSRLLDWTGVGLWLSLADGRSGLRAGTHQPVKILVQAATPHLKPLNCVIVRGNPRGLLIGLRRQEVEVDAALCQLDFCVGHAGGVA